MLARERLPGTRPYAWVYRLRTDLVFFQALAPWRYRAGPGLVFVPANGMSGDPRY